MATFGGGNGNGTTMFNPSRVLLGKSLGTKPYMQTSVSNGSDGGSPQPQPTTNQDGTGKVPRTDDGNTLGPLRPIPKEPGPQMFGNTVGPEAIRASGTGPFDPAYRQNLSTFAGGQFFRPNGALSFNPTGKLDDLFARPTGGGNAPVMGMPDSLLSMALSGQPFAMPQPQQTPAQPPTDTAGDDRSNWQDWLNRWRTRGVGGGIFGEQQ
jgi:hypothetical protein